VEIRQGQLSLDDCDISSESAACVAIRDGADPVLRRNKIHDGKRSGVLLRDGALGTLEDNDITGNATSGVIIRTGANTALRGNRIHGNQESGVYAYDQGRGTLEDNDVTGNAFKGVSVRAGGLLIVRRNRINRNGHEAVWVRKGGRAVVEDNDLRGNGWGAWNIARGSETAVTSARNKELSGRRTGGRLAGMDGTPPLRPKYKLAAHPAGVTGLADDVRTTGASEAEITEAARVAYLFGGTPALVMGVNALTS
jgi:parallel beta-helix repeat protein